MSERDLRILQAIERSSMVSTWKEYLCLEIRDGRAVLSHRRYEALGEVSDFAVEAGEGDEEHRIPDFIDGKRVEGTEDEFIVGGELTADPSDTHSEIDLADVDRDALCVWLTERRFELNSELEQIWGGTPLEGRRPRDQGGEESEELDVEPSPIEPRATASVAPVTHLRIGLLPEEAASASAENEYAAEVFKAGDEFHYRAKGVTVPITEHEATMVVRNPFLYYFSTALKLHMRIQQEKNRIAMELRALIGECCPDWEVLQERTREDWFKALKEEFNVSGYQKEGMEEPVEFESESLEFCEEQPAVDVFKASALAEWIREVHDPSVAIEPLVQQLRELAGRTTELQLVPTVTTAGLRYCGTIESSRIRVTMKHGVSAAALDIRPMDCYWETYFDRTFGSMWKSADDL